MQVGLYVGGGKRSFSVQRLVALTYIPTDDTTMDVDHIDGDKLNNHVSNLQWLSRSENIAKAFKQGRVGSRKGKLSGKITGLYLSHEARAILDSVDNKSKFVNDLIISSGTHTETPPSQKISPDITLPDEPVYMVEGGTPPDSVVDDLVKPAEPVINVEKPCCLNDNRPCQHWKWDVGTGEGYVNVLSGRIKEIE